MEKLNVANIKTIERCGNDTFPSLDANEDFTNRADCLSYDPRRTSDEQEYPNEKRGKNAIQAWDSKADCAVCMAKFACAHFDPAKNAVRVVVNDEQKRG